MLEPARVTSSHSHAQTRRSPRDLRLSANLGQIRDIDLVARYERDRRVCDTRRDKPDAMNTPAVRKTRALLGLVAPPSNFGRLGGSKRVRAEQVDGGRGVAAIESVDQVRVASASSVAVSAVYNAGVHRNVLASFRGGSETRRTGQRRQK